VRPLSFSIFLSTASFLASLRRGNEPNRRVSVSGGASVYGLILVVNVIDVVLNQRILSSMRCVLAADEIAWFNLLLSS
jgi:hypothetical protein